MQPPFEETPDIPGWIGALAGAVGMLTAAMAVWFAKRANDRADAANELSAVANGFAERAVRLQEDESRLRVSVEPRMAFLAAEYVGAPEVPRATVRVVNLSAFPVTITSIYWLVHDEKSTGYVWNNPRLASPHIGLPVRLEPRSALTALDFEGQIADEHMLRIRSCVAITECGEWVHGMTQQWIGFWTTRAPALGAEVPVYPDIEKLNAEVR